MGPMQVPVMDDINSLWLELCWPLIQRIWMWFFGVGVGSF